MALTSLYIYIRTTINIDAKMESKMGSLEYC